MTPTVCQTLQQSPSSRRRPRLGAVDDRKVRGAGLVSLCGVALGDSTALVLSLLGLGALVAA